LNNFNNNLSDSSCDFLNIVWPKLQQLEWLKGELLPVEATTYKEWAKKLDVLAGIDAWLVKEKMGLVGIASRVQWNPKRNNRDYPYNTFNIRYSRISGANTEYQKRLAAITSGGELLYPFWMCHAYLENKKIGPLLSLGLVKTTDAIEAIALGLGYNQRNPNDGTIFKCIPWQSLVSRGYKVLTFPFYLQDKLPLNNPPLVE